MDCLGLFSVRGRLISTFGVVLVAAWRYWGVMRQRARRVGESRSEFGRILTRVLIARDLNNADLRDLLAGEGWGKTQAFVNYLVSGDRLPSLHALDLICRVLDLPDDWRMRLHRAAALDAGYVIGEIG